MYYTKALYLRFSPTWCKRLCIAYPGISASRDLSSAALGCFSLAAGLLGQWPQRRLGQLHARGGPTYPWRLPCLLVLPPHLLLLH